MLTAATATDAVSREILQKPLPTFWKGIPKGGDRAQWLQQNFSRIIDQNFARMPARRLAQMLDMLSAQELSNLAQLYINSATMTGRASFALDIAASRLDVVRLGRLSGVFGFAPVYAAVTRYAPQKTNDFIARSSTSFGSPIPGIQTLQRNGRTPSFQAGSTNVLLNYTIEEIYLAFRTAPIGSLSVRAAL